MDCRHQLLVVSGKAGKGVVETGHALKQPGQLSIELVERKGDVGSEFLSGPLGAGANARPDLSFTIFWLTEDRKGFITRTKEQGDIGPFPAAQPIYIGVGTVAVVGIAVAQRGGTAKDQDCFVFSEAVEKASAVSFKIGHRWHWASQQSV